MTVFNADFGQVTKRFYLLMGVIIIAGFSGMWLLGLLGLPIFLSAILGISFKPQQENKAKVLPISTRKREIAA